MKRNKNLLGGGDMGGVIAIKHTQLGIQTKTILFPINVTVRWKCMYYLYIYIFVYSLQNEKYRGWTLESSHLKQNFLNILLRLKSRLIEKSCLFESAGLKQEPAFVGSF